MPRLTDVRHLRFGPLAGGPPPQDVQNMYRQRMAAYGIPVRRNEEFTGNGNGYFAMGTELLADLAEGGVDLAVLGYAAPDLRHEVSMSGYLQQRFGGQPHVFAASDQGRTVGFTALKLALGVAARTWPDRFAVLLLDQATQPCGDPELDAMESTVDHAVGLLFDADGAVGCDGVKLLTDVAPERAAEALAKGSAELAGDREHIVLLGNGFADADCGPVDADPRQLGTAVWARLAEELAAAHDRRRTVLVAEYDQGLGYLGLAAFDVPAKTKVGP